jgi:hypothetical protein
MMASNSIVKQCEKCGRELNTSTDSHYIHVSGWAKVRKRGTNAIMNQIADGLLRCATCMGTQEMEGQQSMFGE